MGNTEARRQWLPLGARAEALSLALRALAGSSCPRCNLAGWRSLPHTGEGRGAPPHQPSEPDICQGLGHRRLTWRLVSDLRLHPTCGLCCPLAALAPRWRSGLFLVTYVGLGMSASSQGRSLPCHGLCTFNISHCAPGLWHLLISGSPLPSLEYLFLPILGQEVAWRTREEGINVNPHVLGAGRQQRTWALPGSPRCPPRCGAHSLFSMAVAPPEQDCRRKQVNVAPDPCSQNLDGNVAW